VAGDGAKFRRTLRVIYPLGDSGGRIVLRTERDWSRDVLPDAPEEGGHTFTFTLESERPFLYVKPCLRVGEELRFAPGTNKLILMTEPDERPIYPHFLSAPGGRFAPAIAFDSTRLGREHRIRIYLPPGYSENVLKRYPVLYMQDGQNLFFPEEAFAADWQVDRTVGLLDSMNAIDEFVVVGVYSRDRMAEYTKPGYTAYGESLIGEVKPRIDREFRTMPEPERTGVIGSSLGGVVSFFLAWEWPEVFGGAACLSSTFGHQDDLLERVMSEEKRHARFYLDSGWPEDNYEVTVAMAMALVSRGWVYGRDLLHFAFPLAEHDERSWGLRLHLPLQLFQGSVRNVSNRVQAAAEAAAEEKPPPEV
jgi:predicted alpha/beta superfamily hydrolase